MVKASREHATWAGDEQRVRLHINPTLGKRPLEWQAGERAADVDLAAGRVASFDSGEALIDGLRMMAKPPGKRRR